MDEEEKKQSDMDSLLVPDMIVKSSQLWVGSLCLFLLLCMRSKIILDISNEHPQTNICFSFAQLFRMLNLHPVVPSGGASPDEFVCK